MGLVKKAIDWFINTVPYGDKILHFLAGVLLTVIFSLVVSPDLACGFAIVVGLAKEMKDLWGKKRVASLFDYLATVVGALIGYLIV